VRRRHVDHIRGVDVDVDAGLPQRAGRGGQHRPLPALRIPEEELHDVGVELRRVGEGVILVDVGSDPQPVAAVVHARSFRRLPSRRPAWPAGSRRPHRAAGGRRATLERAGAPRPRPPQTFGSKPPCAIPRAAPTNAATVPATMNVRWAVVDEMYCAKSPAKNPIAPRAEAIT